MPTAMGTQRVDTDKKIMPFQAITGENIYAISGRQYT